VRSVLNDIAILLLKQVAYSLRGEAAAANELCLHGQHYSSFLKEMLVLLATSSVICCLVLFHEHLQCSSNSSSSSSSSKSVVVCTTSSWVFDPHHQEHDAGGPLLTTKRISGRDVSIAYRILGLLSPVGGTRSIMRGHKPLGTLKFPNVWRPALFKAK
jgi:hypothetical protein